MTGRKGKKSYYRVLLKNLLLAFVIPVLTATVIISVFQARQDLNRTHENLEISAGRLAGMLDRGALEQAAKSGDNEALRALLGSVLRTEEGRHLAESVRRLMREEGK